MVIDDGTQETIEQLTFSPTSTGRIEYRGTQKPVAGKRYSLQLQSPQYGSAMATETVPPPVEIQSVEIDSSGLNSPDGRVRFDITFQDKPGERNYYSLSMQIESHFLHNNDTIRYTQPIYLETDDPQLQQDYYTGNELLVDDFFFDGKKQTLRVKIASFYYQPELKGKIYVMLSHLSEGYYKYLDSFNLQQSVSGDPFAQPVQVYSNIQNGLGILGASNPTVWVIAD